MPGLEVLKEGLLRLEGVGDDEDRLAGAEILQGDCDAGGRRRADVVQGDVAVRLQLFAQFLRNRGVEQRSQRIGAALFGSGFYQNGEMCRMAKA